MSNINSNRISQFISDGDIQSAKDHFKGIDDLFPFLTGLTVEERISLPKINVVNKVFVKDSIDQMSNNSEMLPAYLNTVEMQKDLILYDQLNEMIIVSREVTEKLEDTQMLAGSEAFVSALAGYRLFAAAAVAGVPGADTAYGLLKTRFKNMGGTSDPAAPSV